MRRNCGRNRWKISLMMGILLMAVFCIAARASAEISTNLQKVTTYTTKNKVKTQSFVDREGNIVVADDLGYATLVNTYTTNTNLSKTEYFDANGNPVNNVYGFAVRKLDYAVNNIKLEVFLDVDGNAAPGPGGYARRETEWYGGKRHIETRYYDTEGNLFRSAAQYAVWKTEYNEKAANKWLCPLSQTYYDADGNMMRGPDGYARMENEYVGGSDRVSKITYYDANGNLYYNRKTGYAIVERVDKGGRFVKESYYGANGELCAGPKGYASVERAFGTETKPVKEAYFDVNGEPYQMPGGYYSLTWKYALKGRIAEEAYFDAEGNPCLCQEGYHAIRKTYRKDGQITQQIYVGLDGKWMKHPTLGYALLVNNYDGKRKTDTTYYDEKKVITDCAEGYAKVVYGFDGNRHETGIKYLHADGTAAIGPDGYARVDYTTDRDGNIITRKFYNSEGSPVLNADGADEIVNTWANKLKLTEAYYVQGEQVLNGNGVHLIAYEYNGEGKVTRESCFGTDGMPCVNDSGYAVKATEYLSSGKAAAVRYYDASGALILTPGKTYAYQRTEYSDDGDVYTVSSFDTENHLMLVDGYAMRVCETNEDGLVVSEAYFGVSGEPVLHGKNKYHRVDRTYLDKNHVTSEAWFDVEDQPQTNGDTYVRIEKDYDANGNVIAERTYDANGTLIPRKEGYDEIRRVYNDRKQAIEFRYYLGGKPFPLANGYAIMTRSYDDQGLVASEAYFGAEGEPVMHAKNKYHRIDKTYLDKDHVTSEAWFDLEDHPMTRGDTYVRIEKDYDANGNGIADRTYDANGELIARQDGYDEIRRVYNEKKQVIAYQYYLTGEPVLMVGGYAIMTRSYDEQGLVASEAYFGTEGEPVLHAKNNYHRVDRTYLDKDHVTSESWYDLEDQPQTRGDTYVRIEKDYDERKNGIADRTYDANGNQIPRKDGYDEIRRVFNELNQAVRREYYLKGQLVMNGSGYAIAEVEYDEKGNAVIEKYYDTERQPVLCKKGYTEVRREYDEKNKVKEEKYFDLEGQEVVLE